MISLRGIVDAVPRPNPTLYREFGRISRLRWVGNERLWKLEYGGAGSESSSLGKAAGVEARLGPAMLQCSLVQAVAGLDGGKMLVLGSRLFGGWSVHRAS